MKRKRLLLYGSGGELPRRPNRPATEHFYPGRLQKTRARAGFSQKSLAERAGIAVRTLQDWEGGRHRPSRALLPKVLQALQVTTDAVLTPPDDICACSAGRFSLARTSDRGARTEFWFCPTCDVQDADLSAIQDACRWALRLGESLEVIRAKAELNDLPESVEEAVSALAHLGLIMRSLRRDLAAAGGPNHD